MSKEKTQTGVEAAMKKAHEEKTKQGAKLRMKAQLMIIKERSSKAVARATAIRDAMTAKERKIKQTLAAQWRDLAHIRDEAADRTSALDRAYKKKGKLADAKMAEIAMKKSLKFAKKKVKSLDANEKAANAPSPGDPVANAGEVVNSWLGKKIQIGAQGDRYG